MLAMNCAKVWLKIRASENALNNARMSSCGRYQAEIRKYIVDV